MALYKQFVLPRKYVLFSFLLGYSCLIVLFRFCSTTKQISHMYTYIWGFHDGLGGKESTCNAGDPHFIPGWGRSPGEGNDYPLQDTCLENFMDKEA